MKALVYAQPNQVTYRDEPEPQLAEGEVIIGIVGFVIDVVLRQVETGINRRRGR